jgi:REP element-mobilizing transposase RayT
LKQVIARANARRGPFQAELTLEIAKRIARGLVGSAVARAQEHCDVKVFALVVMSNHIHLVVQTKHKNLAKFMGYLKGAMTKSVNLLTGKRGTLWARRYDAEAILDDAAAAGRVAYTLDNPVHANLVKRHDEWPGLNLAFGMGDRDELRFEWLDRTGWQHAGRKQPPAAFFAEATLRLSPVPACAGMSRAQVCKSVRGWLKANHEPNDKPALGVDKVVHTGFEARPRNAKYRRRPYAFGCRELKREHYRAMMAVHAAHEAASEAFCAEDFDVPFPDGTYRPPIPRPQAA